MLTTDQATNGMDVAGPTAALMNIVATNSAEMMESAVALNLLVIEILPECAFGIVPWVMPEYLQEPCQFRRSAENRVISQVLLLKIMCSTRIYGEIHR